MATTIRGGERRPHQNYNLILTGDMTVAPPLSPALSPSPTTAPPPSPAPSPATGTSRLSAPPGVDISIKDYLSKSLKIPILDRLLAPPSTLSAASIGCLQPRLPAQVDFRLLVSGVGNSIDRMMRSVKEFGLFRVTGHGIPKEELVAARAVVEVFFRRLDDRKNRFKRSFVERVGNRDEFVWVQSDKAMTLWAREVLGPSQFRHFSYKMESLVSRLDKISEDLGEIFLTNSERRFEENIRETESIVSIYRYNDTNPSILVSNEDSHECRDHVLGLHLAMEHGEFFADTNKGPLSFGVDQDTIVVTIGDQLMEWSGRDFKCATGEVIFESNMNESEPSSSSSSSFSSSSYSLQLKCCPLNLNFGYTKKNANKISILDQILVLLILTFLYKLLFPSKL